MLFDGPRTQPFTLDDDDPLGLQHEGSHRKRNAQKGGNVNDTEPTQRGRGLFTEGRSRRESGAIFYNLYTQQKTPRVKERSFTSLARLFPEYEDPYIVGHVCFIDRYLGFQQLTIDQTL